MRGASARTQSKGDASADSRAGTMPIERVLVVDGEDALRWVLCEKTFASAGLRDRGRE